MTYLIWALFGNDTDTVDGDQGWQTANGNAWWFHIIWLRRIIWWFRNPFHNLCFFVFGVVGQTQVFKGRFNAPFAGDAPQGAHDVFNWGLTYTDKHVLPYVSYDGPFGRNALGWAPGGAFRLRPSLQVAAIALAIFLIEEYT